MSLDVYLTVNGIEKRSPEDPAIFVRINGSVEQVDSATWDRLFPGQKPVTLEFEAFSDEVFEANITHNLNKMADEAGIYEHLWRPDEIGITKAEQLIEPLQTGLAMLRQDPARFRAFNPSNGWGDYEGLVSFVDRYLSACKKYPEANVRTCR